MPVISHQIVAVDLANGIGRHRSEGIFFGYGYSRNSMRLWEHQIHSGFCFVVLLEEDMTRPYSSLSRQRPQSDLRLLADGLRRLAVPQQLVPIVSRGSESDLGMKDCAPK